MRKSRKRNAPLPAYARPLADARQEKLVPRRQDLAHVVVSLEWRDPAPGYPVVVLPQAADPFEFDWRFLAGLDVLVMHCESDKHKAYRVMEALYCYRAARVELFNMDTPEITRFVPLFGGAHGKGK